ncbi:magnesium and cobalt exporter, CNNM family [Frankia sp. AiPs1]|uniref:hemolysin family protein n=1 Tax=Frankia sp. AiPa1 TaxID=573492 RepID=UPI00202B7351|nr:hemolysin family protein [Frankia sp. AiPa1]MCL9761737.1 hemolysin family protein [Frankia sp. AiPa1]
MSSGDLLLLFLTAVGALAAAGFGCVDAALTRVSRVAVDAFVRAGRGGSASLAAVVADPGRYLAPLLLLRIGAEMLAAACLTVLFVHAYGAGFAAVGLGALAATLIAYVLVGVMFRTLGRQHAPGVALATAGLTLRLARVLGPLPRLLIAFGNAVTPGPGYRDGPFASEAELRDLVDLAEENEVIEPEERDMIASVFELGDTVVREVMVPRPDMLFIESTKTVGQALSLALRSGFSRIPVIGDSVDDVVGIAFLKDMVRHERVGEPSDPAPSDPAPSDPAPSGAAPNDADAPIVEIMRAPALVPESKPAGDLLREMQASRTHMAIVIDEYGGTAGLVTIEDILEEIVGEITDEYDNEVPPVEWLDADTARVTARLDVDDLGELFALDVDDLPGADDSVTVGGLLATALGRVPIPGATATVAGLRLTAERAAGRRNQIGTIVVARRSARASGAGPPGAGSSERGSSRRDVTGPDMTGPGWPDPDRAWSASTRHASSEDGVASGQAAPSRQTAAAGGPTAGSGAQAKHRGKGHRGAGHGAAGHGAAERGGAERGGTERGGPEYGAAEQKR